MNEFEIRELKVGDRISRRAWGVAATVDRVERGIGSDIKGEPELQTVKVWITLMVPEADKSGGKYTLDLTDLIAEDWTWVPDGHLKTRRSLKHEELLSYLRTGERPQDWEEPTNPPQSLGELIADRFQERVDTATHWFNRYLSLEAALLTVLEEEQYKPILAEADRIQARLDREPE